MMMLENGRITKCIFNLGNTDVNGQLEATAALSSRVEPLLTLTNIME